MLQNEVINLCRASFLHIFLSLFASLIIGFDWTLEDIPLLTLKSLYVIIMGSLLSVFIDLDEPTMWIALSTEGSILVLLLIEEEHTINTTELFSS